MILKIIFSLAAFFTIIWAIKINKSRITIISIGLVLGIALSIISEKLFFPGLAIYVFSCLVMVFYAFFIIKRKFIIRLLIALPPALMSLFWIWRYNHWHGNTLIAPIVVLCIVLIIISGKFKIKQEAGLLVLITFDAITVIAEQLMKNYL